MHSMRELGCDRACLQRLLRRIQDMTRWLVLRLLMLEHLLHLLLLSVGS